MRKMGLKEHKQVYDEIHGGTKSILVRANERNKFSLNDEEILKLSKWAMLIEEHYSRPMDIEWAKDGIENEIYIVQARPETIHKGVKKRTIEIYKLKERKEPILKGIAIGNKIAIGVKNALDILKEGYIYEGYLKYEVEEINLENLRRPKTKIMMNVGNPTEAFRHALIPNDGVGLARMEFNYANWIQKNEEIKRKILDIAIGYNSLRDFFIYKLAEGIGSIAGAFYPNDVIVRFSDFKSKGRKSHAWF